MASNRQSGPRGSAPDLVPQPRRHDVVDPLGAYALRDGDRWLVIVVSRKLDGHHDGHDFADGQTPVTLRLPFREARKITLHKLIGDPALWNREQLTIQPQSQEIPTVALAAGALGH